MTPRTPVSTESLILDVLDRTPAIRDLLQRLRGGSQRLHVQVGAGSAGAAAAGALTRSLGRVVVCVADSPNEAARLQADLEQLLGEGSAPLFPQREALPHEEGEPHLEIGGLRVEAVEALFAGDVRVLVTTLRALQERSPLPGALSDLRIELRVGQQLDFTEFAETLENRGFDRVSLVEEVGQFAVRGGLVDVFSFGNPDPIRIEFWGDEIVSIRHFDILDQRSVRETDEVHLLPVDFLGDSGGPADDDELRSLLEVLPADTLLVAEGTAEWRYELERTWSRGEALVEELRLAGESPHPVGELFLEPDRAAHALDRFPRLVLHHGGDDDEGEGADPAPGRGAADLGAQAPGAAHIPSIHAQAPPVIERDMDRLAGVLREGAARGRTTLLLCDNVGQLERLEEILGGPAAIPAGTRLSVGSLAGGFHLSGDADLLVLTDHEIFRRSRRLRRSRRFRGSVALESLSQLTPGDYVVHMDHGVGMFKGLQRVEVAGEAIESLAIEYAGGETLRVPVYRLDLLERWVGEADDSVPPHVHKIGGKRWRQLRKKTEEAIQRMATELLELYARRDMADGFAFSPDTRWQREMESSFLYDDTPDQRRAAEEVKRDMEDPTPMDRLVCGDVGYGKTEVAVRAAFKAVQDGKQVAVLAPTTILVEQHRHTFEERLADYPVKVGALSRFRRPKEQKVLLEKLETGDVDVVVGTHRLLSSDVNLKDLGLLIIDEEQRFGVKHKERLKEMRESIDVLTLTATPIPRTLQLSLSGLRNLSLIQTPPRDRQPILTYVLPWSDRILGEAIHREMDRGGQVYVLHNRIETIHTVAERIRELAPEATITVAHGQMTPRELDEHMHAFVDGDADILVSTSIIENGLDVPNANTLIVDRADRFGLAQLYQIRGRVGRSDRRAYCYLVVPDQTTEDAHKRLRVLEHYTELGSGYSVALKDLELRGAGNLLGADQSGYAHAVGIDTYMRLMERTVKRLKEGEGAEHEDVRADISLAGSAYLPDEYIQDESQKLHLYRRLSRMEEPEEVEALREELRDRFGPLPDEAERLLDADILRILGTRLGIERIFVRGREARITFRPLRAPRLNALERPFSDRQISVEVRRMDPLSLTLRQEGTEPMTLMLIQALRRLLESSREKGDRRRAKETAGREVG
jgi:transcription-repair coupling factor (superfamily II helicase)